MSQSSPRIRSVRLLSATFAITLILHFAVQRTEAQTETTNTNETSYTLPLLAAGWPLYSAVEPNESDVTSLGGSTFGGFSGSSSGIPLNSNLKEGSLSVSSIVVDGGYNFYSITNGTGRTTVTGGSSLQVYGTGVGTDTADTQSVYTQFNSINLSVGESIRFEFTMRNFNHVGSSSSGLRIAFADMPTSVGDVATLNPNWASGTPRNTYTMLVPVSGLTSPGAGNVLLREATNIQNPLAGTGLTFPTLASYALPNGSQSNKFSFIVTRDATNSVLINGAIGSVQFAQQSDTTNPFISFNTLQLGLRVYGSNNGFTVNDFNISSIPAWQTTYIGATNGTNNWLSGTNWITGARPNTNGLTVIFTNTANVSWTNATNTIGALLVSGGAVSLGSTNSGVIDSLLLAGSSNAPVVSNATHTTIHAKLEGTNGFTKLGAGTLILSGSNSYSGGTLLVAGVLRAEHIDALGTGILTQSNGDSVLEIATAGTLANQMSIYNVRVQSNATLTGAKTLNNATYDIASATTTIEQGALSGDGGIHKIGAGTLVLNGSTNNIYTGPTTVAAGTLVLSNSSGHAIHSSLGLTISNGATLLLGSSAQVADDIVVTLSGGTIIRSSGVSEVFGNLALTDDSFLDFGSGTAGSIEFGSYTPSSLLTVNNFFPGNTLTFTSDLSESITNTNYFSFTDSFNSAWDAGSGTFTITAIPEASTAVAALLLLGLLAFPLVRRSQKEQSRR